jgi:GNAT superfamily N-acetyltransferase
VARRIVQLLAEALPDIPQPCSTCAFWELGPGAADDPSAALAQATVKAEWLTATTIAWGPCGLVACVDDVPAGYLVYAPPAFVPRASAFPTAPIASDAVLLTAARVDALHADAGVGRALVQAMAKDLTSRGVRAVEAYAGAGEPCLLPARFLEAVGFVRVRDHARHPRLRLDLRAAVTWRDPVGEAWERIRTAVRPFPAGANRVQRDTETVQPR